MKRFKFPLETALKVRKIELDREQVKLGKIQAELVNKFGELNALAELHQESVARERQAKLSAPNPQLLQQTYYFFDRLHLEIERCRQEIRAIEQRLEAQRKVVTQFHIRKESLSRYKESRLAEYRREARITEQHEMDETALNRPMVRKQHEASE